MDRETSIPQYKWEVIIQNAPLVSVDLVVHYDEKVILGKRANEPAKGEWFVPGGRLSKHERLEDAVHRIAKEELGIAVTIDRQLGVYEHFYDVAEMEDVGGKHYVPIAYLVTAKEKQFHSDNQHEDIQWFKPPFDEIDLHPYVRTYLMDAGFLPVSE